MWGFQSLCMVLTAGTLATLLREEARETPVPVYILPLHWGVELLCFLFSLSL